MGRVVGSVTYIADNAEEFAAVLISALDAPQISIIEQDPELFKIVVEFV